VLTSLRLVLAVTVMAVPLASDPELALTASVTGSGSSSISVMDCCAGVPSVMPALGDAMETMAVSWPSTSASFWMVNVNWALVAPPARVSVAPEVAPDSAAPPSR
jgi:hypothetical protein